LRNCSCLASVDPADGMQRVTMSPASGACRCTVLRVHPRRVWSGAHDSAGAHGDRMGVCLRVPAPSTLSVPLGRGAFVAFTRVSCKERQHGMTSPLPPEDASILSLQLRDFGEHELWLGSRSLRSAPSGHGAFTFLDLKQAPRAYLRDPFEGLPARKHVRSRLAGGGCARVWPLACASLARVQGEHRATAASLAPGTAHRASAKAAAPLQTAAGGHQPPLRVRRPEPLHARDESRTWLEPGGVATLAGHDVGPFRTQLGAGQGAGG